MKRELQSYFNRGQPVKKESGQALLIVLLVMAVVLTIGLSVVSRSVTDIKISQQEEESARALSAAEAGVEEALKSGSLNPVDVGPVGGTITAYITKSDLGGQRNFNFGGTKFAAGDTQTLWLANHDSNGNVIAGGWSGNTLTVYWGNSPASSTLPAMEATLVYRVGINSYRQAKYAYDSDFTRAGPGRNGFTQSSAGTTLDGVTYAYKATLNTNVSPAQIYFLRIKLLYNDNSPQIIAVQVPAGTVVPVQGTCYESTASVPSSGVTRKVRQCEYFKTPPGIFDYVLFSGTNLEKN